ncbi:MAG: hypothetical protein HKN21_03320 [Candidatus Eisenbacteria bacterium]|uniref:Uncharacterized protein n=1 Tax=Eiseniibacteriota bacterium TaxID=2212470 RepID=A0A7Y2H1L1_UNCEI|nr:hypothetical protein [Candidatus Eisenbacteria bacterium]
MTAPQAGTPSNPDVIVNGTSPAGPAVNGPVYIMLGPQQSCTRVYDNSSNFTGQFYSAQSGSESIDDLHGLESGALCEFNFGYNEPGPGPVDATITFYANDGSDLPPISTIAGPYNVTGLPSGANDVTVTVPAGPVISKDVWMGVQFSTSSAGLLINDPPVVGASDDYFYEDGNYFSFGGNPQANFWLYFEVELAVPVEKSTWGGIKQLHD